MDQFKEIHLLESLLNFQRTGCNFCHVPSKCYHFRLQNGKQCKGASGVLQNANHGVKRSDKHVYRIVNCIEQLAVN